MALQEVGAGDRVLAPRDRHVARGVATPTLVVDRAEGARVWDVDGREYLCAGEVITGFGRVGAWFGSERYDIRPDIVTCARGLSSAYAAIGAVIATDRVLEPFVEGTRIVEGVAENEERFRETLAQLLELPICGDLRGAGYFWAVELVKDKETRETFTSEECESLLRGFLSNRLFEKGLICRADDRGDPVLQISPPLVATQHEFDEIVGILGDVLAEAWERVVA